MTEPKVRDEMVYIRQDVRGSLRRPDASDVAREVVMAALDTRGYVALYLYPDNRVEIVRVPGGVRSARIAELPAASLVGVYRNVSRLQVRDDILAMPRGETP